MAEFTVKPEDYLPGGRLYDKPNVVVVSPEGVDSVTDKKTGVTYEIRRARKVKNQIDKVEKQSFWSWLLGNSPR